MATSDGAVAWEQYRSESGAILHWDEPGVALGMTVAPPPLSSSSALGLLREATLAWTQGDCAGPALTVAEVPGGRLDEGDGKNSVVWVTDKAAWTARFPASELARTILIYRVQSGRLVDTDIAVNVAHFDFHLGEDCDAQRYDLRTLFTHELGHVLGLDHSAVGGATMVAEISPGSCEGRSLSDDDRAGYCATYPPRPEPGPESAPEPTPEPVEPADRAEAEPAPRDEGCGQGRWSLLAACGFALALVVGPRAPRRSRV